MSLTDQDVNHVARLARLSLTEEERVRMRTQLGKILDHIAALNKYDTADVPPTSHVVAQPNTGREDDPRVFDNIEGILAGAPDKEDVFFKVPKVIE
jgi:aspartyl-tRNA(Asn)/glutamyl-tRNA(Gln) amidotransferase subunit C